MRILIFTASFALLFFSENLAQSSASDQMSKFSIEAPQLGAHKTIWILFPEQKKVSQPFRIKTKMVTLLKEKE